MQHRYEAVAAIVGRADSALPHERSGREEPLADAPLLRAEIESPGCRGELRRGGSGPALAARPLVERDRGASAEHDDAVLNDARRADESAGKRERPEQMRDRDREYEIHTRA